MDHLLKSIFCCKNRCQKSDPNKLTEVNLLIIGLNGSGKTELINQLCGKQRSENYQATRGVEFSKFKYNGTPIAINECGGSDDIRPIWGSYYKMAMGIIFTVDTTDIRNVFKSQELFNSFIHHRHVIGKPIMVVLTHQDGPDHLTELDVTEILQLETLANRTRSLCYIIDSEDDVINIGIHWLVKCIKENLRAAKNRTDFDSSMLDNLSRIGSAKLSNKVRAKREVIRPKTAPAQCVNTIA